MKKFYTAVFLLLGVDMFAQNVHNLQLNISEQNDFFNLAGKGTDKAFTNGTRIDFLYEKNKGKSRFLLDRLFPKAGDSSTNTYAWGLMQVIVTPGNTAATTYLPDDYSYAGALLASHSLFSYNPKRKLTLQTDLIAGIRGPAAFAKEIQTGFHQLINDPLPKGWNNQLNTKLLLNLEFTVTKSLFSIRNAIDMNVAVKAAIGSFADFIVVYPTIRIGKLPVNEQQKKIHYYVFCRPYQSAVLYNTMLETKSRPDAVKKNPGINHFLFQYQVGVAMGTGRWNVQYAQTYSNPYRRNLYKHSFGNIILGISLGK